MKLFSEFLQEDLSWRGDRPAGKKGQEEPDEDEMAKKGWVRPQAPSIHPTRNDLQWGNRFSKKLSDLLKVPVRTIPTPAPVGSVAISFHKSDEGYTDNLLIIYKSTGADNTYKIKVSRATGVFVGHEKEIEKLLQHEPDLKLV
jgi:hypothetical protein